MNRGYRMRESSFVIARAFAVTVAASVVLLQPTLGAVDAGGRRGGRDFSPATANVPNDEAAVTHALNRLAFGARPRDVQRVQKIGLATWIEQQLNPEAIRDDSVQARLNRLNTLDLDPQTIAEEYIRPAREERRRRLLAAPANGTDSPEMNEQMAGSARPATRSGGASARPPAADPLPESLRRARQVIGDLSEAKIIRAVYSERQLEEVLVDFWFNHFNVFARKGRTELYVGEYEREAIRPHVLGKFRDLLEATAKSPAMLFYLDNWMSADPSMEPMRPGSRRLFQGAPARQTQQQQQQRGPRGLNENYARELLELHTLGVDGGYTQDDVIAVARAFTGWTIAPMQRSGFRFVPAMHDRKEKRVLGHVIPAGGGIDDGQRVLDILADHPSTAKHIAFQLAQRFVSDTPPAAIVDRAAARFRETKGDLREVVRSIVTSPEFYASEARAAKVKTPFEFAVSALRVTGADITLALPIARALATMGMPLYLCQPPTGYGETADAWLSSGALVNRINFALELAGNRLRGARIEAGGADFARMLGSPEFQRQ